VIRVTGKGRGITGDKAARIVITILNNIRANTPGKAVAARSKGIGGLGRVMALGQPVAGTVIAPGIVAICSLGAGQAAEIVIGKLLILRAFFNGAQK
jgi:hypothetical protein